MSGVPYVPPVVVDALRSRAWDEPLSLLASLPGMPGSRKLVLVSHSANFMVMCMHVRCALDEGGWKMLLEQWQHSSLTGSGRVLLAREGAVDTDCDYCNPF